MPTLDRDIAPDKPERIGPNRLGQDGFSRHNIAHGRQRAEFWEGTSRQDMSSIEYQRSRRRRRLASDILMPERHSIILSRAANIR
jgi:hypothetical protein